MANKKKNDSQSANFGSSDRRQFLRTSSAAGAAGLFAVHTATAADEKAAGKVVNLGIVGAGGRGTGALTDSFDINDNVRLIAMADLDAKKCASKRDQLIRRYGDRIAVDDNHIHAGLDAYRRVLDNPDVDCVLFATPPGFRPRHVADAVEAGKHVFAEKPVCVDSTGYRICLDAHRKAEANGTSIVTGTQYRRQVNYIGAIEQLREGLIGTVKSATSRYCSNGIWYKPRKEGMSDAEYQLDNWMHFIWLSGDEIAEQAVHNIDLMNWLMDSPPETAYGSGGRFTRPEDSEMWDSMSIDYGYPGDRFVSFMCRQIPSTQSENGTVIYGSEGTMVIHAISRGSEAFDKQGNKIWSMDGSIADAYKQEHKDLVDSIVNGKPIVELKQTADSSLTAVMGRLAAYSGQKVSWDFVTEESQLDLFPEGLTMESSLPEPAFAVPGQYKLT